MPAGSRERRGTARPPSARRSSRRSPPRVRCRRQTQIGPDICSMQKEPVQADRWDRPRQPGDGAAGDGSEVFDEDRGRKAEKDEADRAGNHARGGYGVLRRAHRDPIHKQAYGGDGRSTPKKPGEHLGFELVAEHGDGDNQRACGNRAYPYENRIIHAARGTRSGDVGRFTLRRSSAITATSSGSMGWASRNVSLTVGWM